MDIPKVPNIMSIKGVFVKNARSITELVEEKKDATPKDPLLKSLPSKFTNLASWPSSSEIKCWTCNRNADTRPISIQTAIDRNRETKELERTMVGCFYHWPCAAWHIQWFMNNNAQYKVWLQQLYEEFTGRKCYGEIVPCLPPWRMRECSGDLTYEDWVKLSEAGNEKFQHHMQELLDGKTQEVQFLSGEAVSQGDDIDFNEPSL